MATPTAEEFQQVATQLQGLMQRVTELTQELTISRQRESVLESRIEQSSNLTALVETIATGQAKMTEELVRSRGKEMTLIDNRGVAKPEKFKGDEGNYLHWKMKTESFILSVFPELEKPLAWAEEQEAAVSMAQIRAEFGPGGAQGEVEGLEHKVAQVYAVLQNLLEGEPFSILRNILKGNGLEGWRKLARRYDSATGGRKTSLLRYILAPERQKLSELSAYLEQWMELVRRYEDRRGTGGRSELPNDIKISLIESICPVELEKHLQLNRQRLDTFEDVYEEIASYLETRVGIKLKIGSGNAGPSGGDPMDVGAFHKGGKGGKKGGKGGKKGNASKGQDKGKCNVCGKPGHWARDCWHKGKEGPKDSNKNTANKEKGKCNICGKPGHWAKDCWHKGKDQNKRGNGKKGGKGKAKGRPKGTNNVEEVEEEYEEEPKQEPEAETGFLLLAALEREERDSKGSGNRDREKESERVTPARPQPVSAAESRVAESSARSFSRALGAMAPKPKERPLQERGRSPVRKEKGRRKGEEKGKEGAGKAKSSEARGRSEPPAASAAANPSPGPVVVPKLEGVPESIRLLAQKRANRLVAEGAGENWRETPTSYSQRLMAAKEASRGMRGSVAQAVYRNTLRRNTGLDEACSSCDDRQKRAKSVVRAFARASVRRIRERLAAKRERKEAKEKKRKMEKSEDEESLYECEDDLIEVEKGVEGDDEGTSDQEANDVATTLVQELSPQEEPEEPEEKKPENLPGQRTVGSSSSMMMHRVVEFEGTSCSCKPRLPRIQTPTTRPRKN